MNSRNLTYLFLALCLVLPVAKAGRVGALLEQNRIAEAVTACRQANAMRGTDKTTLLECAEVYFRANRISQAEALMDRLRADYQSPNYQLLQALALTKKKKFNDAGTLLDKLVKANARSPVGYKAQELKAELYEAKGNLDAAAFVYKQLAGDLPNNPKAQWGLGRYYLARNDVVRAKRHLIATAKLWPRHMGSRYNLALIAMTENNMRQATYWLSQAYQLNMADVGVLEQLGVLYEKRGNFDKAVKYWQRAVMLKGEAPIAKKKLAKYVTRVVDQMIDEKRFADALVQIDSSPLKDSPQLALRKGIILRNTGQWERAVGELIKYTKYNQRSGLAFRELGIAYVNLKLISQAAEVFGKATSLEPRNGINYAWLAFVLETKGDMLRARDAWRTAMGLLKDPNEVSKATRRLAAIEKQLNAAQKQQDRPLAQEPE